jgi:sialate O-acetylesterase
MFSRHSLAAIFGLVLLPVSLNTGYAQQPSPVPAATTLPFISPIFGDNMVLQRNKLGKIWGWSEPGDTVRVEIGSNTASAVAGADRRWQVEFRPLPAGGPYTVKITGRQSVEFKNVLFGDVWLCGGQSNMEFKLRGALNGADEVKAANYPQIRFFTVASHPAYHHTDLLGGTWNAVSPETSAQASAVAYYFARRVQQDIHIPIGLVVDCVGGTPAETWTSVAALRQIGGLDVPLAELQRVSAEGGPEYGNYIMSWYDQYDVGMKENWSDFALDDSSWKCVDIFGGFAALGVPDTPAVVWFRKEVVLPDPLPAGAATMFLGSIERMDTVYVNGTFIGGSAWVENPRVYRLGVGVLKPGKNIIAIRVLKTESKGGFLGKPEGLHILISDNTSVSLAGAWKAKLSVDARPPHPLPISYENWPVMPSVLYQGMLEPVAPLSITGAIWYQGEANAKRGFEYRKVLPAMIADWRKLFGQGDFPFYVVSLPAYEPRSATPIDDAWAETRESQAITVATVPNTCLAVTIDTGDPSTVHPKEKIPVGDRLAYCALAKNYGEKIPCDGPTFTFFDVLSLAIRLHFAHAEEGLVVKGDKPEEFEIAGDDHKWYWADAHVFGDTVVVSSSAVQNPKAVRYAWQSNPAATLYNKAGLPAVPFRTDNWPGLTDGKRSY